MLPQPALAAVTRTGTGRPKWPEVVPGDSNAVVAARGSVTGSLRPGPEFQPVVVPGDSTFYANNGWLRRPGPWPGAEAVTQYNALAAARISASPRRFEL